MANSARFRMPRVIGYISSVAALTVAVRIAGFLDKIVLTSFFDLSSLEVLFVAISLPMMTFTMTAAIVHPIVLPGFAGRFAVGDALVFIICSAYVLLAANLLGLLL